MSNRYPNLYKSTKQSHKQIKPSLENRVNSIINKEIKIIKEKYDDMNNKNRLLKKENEELKIENEKLKKENKKLIEIIYEKNYKINYFENEIKKKDIDIDRLKISENELRTLLKDSFNKIYEYIDKINEYKEKLENKIGYKLMEIKSLNKNNFYLKEDDKIISKVEDNMKFYGFINNGNSCYLNSSLQLLTRINELKNGILNYQDNEINKDNDTKGQLFVEFKKIINKIENSKNDNLTINSEKLKYIIYSTNEIYYNSQGDSNEFISNFISGLFKETASKVKSKVVQKLDISNELDKKAYDDFYKRFYIKKGYTFLMDIFYGIFKTKNYCKTCKKIVSIKFNVYNMFELPLYKLAKKNKNKTLDLKEILNEYRAEKPLNYKCDNCKNNKKNSEIFTKIFLYTLPKYLILSFIRNVDDEYFHNNIKYDEILDIKTDYDDKSYNYSLESVIEHIGGINSGHYTALCKDKKNNKWYRFNDSYCDKYNCDFHSKNALLLLYKSID